MKFILGKKLKMTQVFDENKKVTPVTIVEAGPCLVTQVRTLKKDGYQAVQVGFGATKKTNKPKEGHLKGLDNFRYLREFRTEDEINKGDKITVDIFEPKERVKVSSISKGKGFAGVVKRHGFAGGPASHGQKHTLRAPGSIGSAFPERVWPGKRMAGRMGSDRVSVQNLEVVKIDAKENLIAIKGAIAGRVGTLIEIIKK